MDVTPAGPEDTGGSDTGTKRKRGNTDDATVSPLATGTPPPKRLLRTAQSTWDDAPKDLPSPTAEHEEWLSKSSWTEPYNPDYDEAAYAPASACRYANPYFKRTNAWVPREQPLPGHEKFTKGPFPNVLVYQWDMLSNLNSDQRRMITDHMENFLFFLPHAGGRALMTHADTLVPFFEKVLSSFQFAIYGGEGVEVTMETPQPDKPGSKTAKNNYARPWGFFVNLENDREGVLREFLLWQQHFAISSSLSFSVHSLYAGDEPQPWKLLIVLGPSINPKGATHADVIAHRSELLENMKSRLEANRPYCDLITRYAVVNIGHTGTRDQVFKTVTDTFHLQPATADTRDGPKPAYILMARPIVAKAKQASDLKRAMLDAICGAGKTQVYIHTQKFVFVDDSKLHTPLIECKLCKADIHRTADCPLPKTKGWRGITPTDMGLADEQRPVAPGPSNPQAAMDAVLGLLKGETKPKEPKKSHGNADAGGWRKSGGKGGKGKGKAPARG
ncbi:hypothetical protein C8Q76DRAFT_653542 [Earliella scabrosa]|nr:hypothetical protein C8Q76DRAFT_653542 [Earliella scabrosa]